MRRWRLNDPRALSAQEQGFSMIELLVVMLVIGVLAAFALAAFFDQRGKASDAEAKAVAHSAQVAMEACGTENDGGYDEARCRLATLRQIEPTLPGGEASPLSVEPQGDAYALHVTSQGTGNVFSIERDGSGHVTYSCRVTGGNAGGCSVTGGEEEGTWGG
jgi:type IV pilus assembly protein PilA